MKLPTVQIPLYWFASIFSGAVSVAFAIMACQVIVRKAFAHQLLSFSTALAFAFLLAAGLGIIFSAALAVRRTWARPGLAAALAGMVVLLLIAVIEHHLLRRTTAARLLLDFAIWSLLAGTLSMNILFLLNRPLLGELAEASRTPKPPEPTPPAVTPPGEQPSRQP
jgi:tryptophan-rich sensory protein